MIQPTMETSPHSHNPGSTCSNTESAVLFANGLRKTYGGRAVVDGVSITENGPGARNVVLPALLCPPVNPNAGGA